MLSAKHGRAYADGAVAKQTAALHTARQAAIAEGAQLSEALTKKLGHMLLSQARTLTLELQQVGTS